MNNVMVSIAIRLEHLERFQFIEKLEALYVRTVDKIKFSLIRRPIFHIAPWSLRKYTVVPLEAIPPPIGNPKPKAELIYEPPSFTWHKLQVACSLQPKD